MIYSHADCFGILFSQQIFDTEFLVVSGWFTAEDSSLDVLKFPFLLSELFGWEFCPSQAGFSLSSAMSGTTNPVSLTSQSVAMATSERHAVNGLVFSAETIKERWWNHREHTYMTCTHTNVCKKKEPGKNAKAGNPKFIWVLCLRRGLEAEGNSSCVLPKFLALGLVLDLGSVTSFSQHTARAFSSWILSW